jgi:hypothetical protein
MVQVAFYGADGNGEFTSNFSRRETYVEQPQHGSFGFRQYGDGMGRHFQIS